MKTLVRVHEVSKKYRLGATRTSIMRLLASSLQNVRRSKNGENENQQELWALQNVSFELSEGQSLGLIGKNGAGKSTLLKLLAKITRPTTGTIEMDGRLSALIELGSGFHHDLSGRENIYLNGTILGLSRREISRRFDEIVEFSEIERFLDTPVKRYSSGMVVRLGFAVASCIEPEILLVDEVLAVGDTAFRQKCLRRIQSLIQEGTSIIFVSHNLYMLHAVCPTSLYIRGGEVKFAGSTNDAIKLYEQDLHNEQAEKFEEARRDVAPGVTNLRITRVEVIDPACQESVKEFKSNQPVEVRVHYQANQPNEHVNAVVRLIRTDGVTCCMLRTSTDHFRVRLQSEGKISVFLDPLQLSGGSFYADARFTNSSDSIVLANAWSDWFYVSSSGFSHETESGIFQPNRRWNHNS